MYKLKILIILFLHKVCISYTWSLYTLCLFALKRMYAYDDDILLCILHSFPYFIIHIQSLIIMVFLIIRTLRGKSYRNATYLIIECICSIFTYFIYFVSFICKSMNTSFHALISFCIHHIRYMRVISINPLPAFQSI